MMFGLLIFFFFDENNQKEHIKKIKFEQTKTSSESGQTLNKGIYKFCAEAEREWLYLALKVLPTFVLCKVLSDAL